MSSSPSPASQLYFHWLSSFKQFTPTTSAFISPSALLSWTQISDLLLELFSQSFSPYLFPSCCWATIFLQSSSLPHTLPALSTLYLTPRLELELLITVAFFPTSSFHHHICTCLGRPFVHPHASLATFKNHKLNNYSNNLWIASNILIIVFLYSAFSLNTTPRHRYGFAVYS